MLTGPLSPRETAFYFALGQVGMEMVVPIAGGLLLDHYFESMPWATVAGVVVGFGGGLAHLLLLLKRHEESSGPGNKRD